MKYRLLVLFFSVFFSSCYSVQQSDFSTIKSDVAQLQVKVESLTDKQTDLYSKYETAMVKNDTQAASLEDLYRKISQLSQKIQDLQAITSKKNGGGDVVVPSTLYQNAYNDFLTGKYDMALSGFKSFIKKYPEHDLSPQGQYYIGECLYFKEDFSNAYEEYKKLEKNFPYSEFVPTSRLKMALCLENLNKKNEAMIVLQSILLNYPNSPEAFTAEEKIKTYTNAKPK